VTTAGAADANPFTLAGLREGSRQYHRERKKHDDRVIRGP
jgi:hypothetical protein